MKVKTFSNNVINNFLIFDKEHPYFTAFIISISIVTVILFKSASLEEVMLDNTSSDMLQFIDI